MSEAEMDETGADDRRSDDRAAITLKVDYKRLNTFFADYTKNISKGGTFIRTTKPLEIGTQFIFSLTVPSARAESSEGEEAVVRLELTGEVKWVVSEADATDEKPAGMGIQFVFNDPAERTRVEDVVADLMRTSLGAHIADKFLSRAQ
ncbi:MAG TPA: TIGR02266 family protein [Labilithrix sp.]|jgi:type IV pilus assembly protein PilZ|nr:TIGR02266 family protein [Labilithrix sp.]